jgi:hypothetical protein
MRRILYTFIVSRIINQILWAPLLIEHDGYAEKMNINRKNGQDDVSDSARKMINEKTRSA